MLYQVLRKLLTLSLYIGIGVGIVACDNGRNEATDIVLATPTNTIMPTARSISANLSGVQVAMRVPPGWSGRRMDGGILIAEQRGSVHNSGKLLGMQVYVFVHPISSFPYLVSSGTHLAENILEHIVSEPSLVGNSVISDPQSFTWDGNDAAYYLLNDNNKNVALVMAVVVANESQLVAINISCPLSRADNLREALPDLLTDLWVDNALMSTTILDALPNPLVYPVYDNKPMPTATP